MGAWGAIIMGFFGAVFAEVTLLREASVSRAVLVAPALVFALIALLARRVIRLPGSEMPVPPAVRRAVMWSTIGEGIGILIAINVAANLGRPDWVLPAVALVVGLHFLPIARAAAFMLFYVLGGALVTAAALGAAVGGDMGGLLAGGAAAAALWIAAMIAIARARRFAAAATGAARG